MAYPQSTKPYVDRAVARDHLGLSRRSREDSPRRASSSRSRTGGRNNTGRITTRHSGGGHKRLYRVIDFKRAQGRRAGQGRRDRVRPQPLGAHRAAPLRRRREALHPRARGLAVGDTVQSGAEADITARQRAAARGHPDRHDDPQHRAAPGQGGQMCRAAGASAQLDGQGGRLRAAAAALRRDAARPVDCRATIGQIGNVDHQNVSGRQGRPHALAGHRPTVRGIGHEPGRPPARRRRGQVQGRPAPGHAGGKPTLGRRTRQEKASTRDIVRGRKRGKGRGRSMSRSSRRARSSTSA